MCECLSSQTGQNCRLESPIFINIVKKALTEADTKDYVKFEPTDLGGTLDLAAGTVTLTVQPVADGWQPMNLRSLILQPVK